MQKKYSCTLDQECFSNIQSLEYNTSVTHSKTTTKQKNSNNSKVTQPKPKTGRLVRSRGFAQGTSVDVNCRKSRNSPFL